MSYLIVLLQGCYQVLERRKKTYLKRFYQLWRAHKTPYRANANNDSTPAGAAASECALHYMQLDPLRLRYRTGRSAWVP